jgi:hypothetical protein
MPLPSSHKASTLYSIAALALAGALVISSSIYAAPTSRAARDLIVKYDQSQILKLDRPVAHIIIGNPTIADVTVQDPELLVITGKTFGITNMIFLDAHKEVIMQQRVMVIRDEGRVVNLQRGDKRNSFNCTPQCNPMVVVGDDPTYFESIAKTSERKIKLSEGDAASPPGGSN